MKKTLFIVLAILTFFSIPVLVFFVGKQQEIRSKAAPATSISLAPENSIQKTGDAFSMNINVDTGGNQAAMTSITLEFDATKLEAQSITVGSLFPKIYTPAEIGSGTASITVGIEHNAKAVVGNGTAAIVRFKAKEATSTPVSVKFGATTSVTGFGEQTANLLVSRTPAIVSVTGGGTVTLSGGSSPTPTTIQSITPTPGALSSYVPLSITSLTTQLSSTEYPAFQGKATPGSGVTLTIPTTAVAATVTVDSYGIWKYTPSIALKPGSYTLIATQPRPGGNVETISTLLTIACAATPTPTNAPANQGVVEATTSAMPTSGSPLFMTLLLIISFLLLTAGLLTGTLIKT